MRRYANNIDSNQKEVIDFLRRCGVWVENMSSTGNNFPDLITNYRGKVVLLEVKAKTTPVKIGQMWFMANYPGYCGIARTPESAQRIACDPRQYGLQEHHKIRLLKVAGEIEFNYKMGKLKNKQMKVKKLMELIGYEV